MELYYFAAFAKQYSSARSGGMKPFPRLSPPLGTHAGLCVTYGAPGPGPVIKGTTMILGRPLANKSFAVLFVNNNNETTTITCDAACVKKLGMPARSGQVAVGFAVEDIWSKQKACPPLP